MRVADDATVGPPVFTHSYLQLYSRYNGRNGRYARRSVLFRFVATESSCGFLQMDNTSNRCMTFPAESCSCEPRILLKWARILFYKVARTYVAKPLLLAFLPLCIGVLVGIWIGKNSQTKQQQQQDDSSSSIQGSTLSFRIIHTLCKWLVPQENLQRKENRVRTHLKSDVDTKRESGVDIQDIPKHVAVIMDGNRRYGKARYGNVAKVRPAFCVF